MLTRRRERQVETVYMQQVLEVGVCECGSTTTSESSLPSVLWPRFWRLPSSSQLLPCSPSYPIIQRALNQIKKTALDYFQRPSAFCSSCEHAPSALIRGKLPVSIPWVRTNKPGQSNADVFVNGADYFTVRKVAVKISWLSWGMEDYRLS